MALTGVSPTSGSTSQGFTTEAVTSAFIAEETLNKMPIGAKDLDLTALNAEYKNMKKVRFLPGHLAIY